MLRDFGTGRESGEGINNRKVRRRLLITLYETYQRDPHAVLTPAELEQNAGLTRDDIMRNIFYLEERGFVKCMKRYGSSLFAAVRISTLGIDLVEDEARLAGLFGTVTGRSADSCSSEYAEEVSVDSGHAVRAIYAAVCSMNLDSEMRHAVLDDVRSLEFELRRPYDRRRPEKIERLLDWIEEALDGVQITELDLLRGLIRSWDESR